MTTCYFVSDLHGSVDRYNALFKMILKNKPSFLFIGGDILPHARFSDKQKDKTINPFIEEFLLPGFINLQKQLGCNYPEVYLILGNDDYKIDIPGIIKGEEKDLWKFLDSKKTRFGPYTIYGYSYVPPTPFRNKDWEKYDVDLTIKPGCTPPDKVLLDNLDNEKSNSSIVQDLKELISDDPMDRAIFMFHTPPYNTLLDKIPSGDYIGSKAVLNLIEEKQPYITLHGHAHESPRLTGSWQQEIGRTRLFSAAHDGKELAIVIFKIDNPDDAERVIVG